MVDPVIVLVEINLICINEKKKHAFVWIFAIGTVLSLCIEALDYFEFFLISHSHLDKKGDFTDGRSTL